MKKNFSKSKINNILVNWLLTDITQPINEQNKIFKWKSYDSLEKCQY